MAGDRERSREQPPRARAEEGNLKVSSKVLKLVFSAIARRDILGYSFQWPRDQDLNQAGCGDACRL